MLFVYKWTRKFYSVLNISKIKTMNLDKCYFRHIQEEDKIDITFLLKIKDAVRQFNFRRKSSESLGSLFTRIGTNVQKAISKAYKKKGNNEKIDVDVKFFDKRNIFIPETTTTLELFDLEKPIKLKIHDHEYVAIFNAPWVLSINMPHSILAGFPVYPEHFSTFNTVKEKCIYNWYIGKAVNDNGKEITDDNIKWQLTGNGFSYAPSAQDVGMKLKLECIPGNETTLGPAVETISKSVVEAGPGKCPFETRHIFTSSKLSGKSFRCVTYNILADLYCDSDYTRTVLHPYCPPYALHIDYRKQLILKELLGYNADIICLQEVDKKIFYHHLQYFLEAEGFCGSFYKKGKEVAEGLACFYRKDRFKLIDEDFVVLSEALQSQQCLSSIWNAIKNNQPFKERLLDRSTVASATQLQSIDNENEILLIGNTHLYFHPDSDHIRLIQGGIAILWLRAIKHKIMQMNPSKRVSLIICGDFNSDPLSGIYTLYTTGSAPSSLPDWKSNENEAVYNLSLQLDIILGSACGTPQYTNFTAGFADCLDYIYYEKSNLAVEQPSPSSQPQNMAAAASHVEAISSLYPEIDYPGTSHDSYLIQVVPFPSEEELRAHTALPSIVFPSDHIALISDLSFNLNK